MENNDLISKIDIMSNLQFYPIALNSATYKVITCCGMTQCVVSGKDNLYLWWWENMKKMYMAIALALSFLIISSTYGFAAPSLSTDNQSESSDSDSSISSNNNYNRK